MKASLRVISLVLAVVLLLGLLGCQPAKQSETDYFADFQAILRFIALSDSHIDDKGTELEEQRLVKALQTANGYAAKDENHSKLDAVLIAGDFVDYGTKTSMEKVRDLLSQNIAADTKTILSLGNHEYYVDKENTATRFEDVFGAGINQHHVINGLHFISISPDESGNAYSSDTVAWLETELAIAAAESSTKPIFVQQHHPVKNTLFLSDYTVAVDNLHSVFAKYPQIVDFSGHSHYPMHNPRQIWQGEYTALGTGTLSYHSLIINNLELPAWYTAVHDGNDGNWVYGHKKNKDGGEFYLVEVDATGAVQIIAYDINADKEIRRYYIRTPSDPASFLYTDKRIAASAAPEFEADATATVSNIQFNGFDLSFPQATCADLVESYRIEVYHGNVLVNTTVLTSCFYMDPLPTTMVAHVRGVPADTALTVKVFAVNAYNKDCATPLTATVTTGKLDLQPADSAPAADVFRAQFGRDSSCDGISGAQLEKVGNIMVVKHPDTKKPIAIFTGQSGYKYEGFREYYPTLSQSVTFETCLRYDNYDDYVRSPMANLQGGGVGFEIDADCTLRFSAYIDGSYKTVRAYPMIPGQYYHVVGTYDGEKLSIYVNGAPVNSLSAPGKITWPTDPTAQFLAIGADSGLDGKLDSAMIGQVCAANVYSQVLTAEQILRSYMNINEKA